MAASASFGTRLAARLIRRSLTTTSHQAIAFDAIACLSSPNANAWQRMFLKQAQLFALGATAPDTEFRDYKNHVVFPRDGYWGGAIPKAQSWYLNLTTALAKREWQNAAYCAGVLSHYVIDALHPLHTAQSEAENDIHFALDVTVWTTYATLARQGTTLKSSPVALSAEPGFLALALCAGAERANQNYEKLLAHFDMARAVTDPAMGLDIIGRQVMAGVIADATQMLAAIFDRAIADAGEEAPQVPLVGASLTAALGLPLAAMANARRTRTSLRQITLMFDELVATGRVTKHLPDEERAKRDLYAKEILGARVKSNVDNVFPFVPKSKASTPAAIPAAEGDEDTGGEVIVLTRNRVKMEPVRPAPRRVEAEPIRKRADVTRALVSENETVAEANSVTSVPAIATRASSFINAAAVGHAAAATLLPMGSGGMPSFRDRRDEAKAAQRISEPVRAQPLREQALGDVLFMGAVDAQLLAAAGVNTIDALLKSDAAVLSSAVGPLPISQEAIADWQDQARLVVTITGVNGGQAHMLAGAGYRSSDAIATADAGKLCADLLAYAGTENGQRALQNGSPPDVEQIRSLIEAARASKAA